MPWPSPPKLPKRATTASHSTLAAMVGVDIQKINSTIRQALVRPHLLKQTMTGKTYTEDKTGTPPSSVTITANKQIAKNHQGLYRTNAALKGLSSP